MSNAKYFKHRRKPLLPDQRKAINKVRKQDRYEPTTATTISTIPKDDLRTDTMYDDNNNNDTTNNDGDTEGLDALRTRIRNRIKEMQESRGMNKNKDTSTDNRIKSKNDKNDKNGNKTKGGTSINSFGRSKNQKVANHQTDSKKITKQESKGLMEDLMMTRNDMNKGDKGDKGESNLSTDIDFGNIAKSLGGSKDKSSGKPGSKTKRLKRMLEVATTKRKRIETLKSGSEQDVKRAREEQWTDVLKIAAGESVVMDTNKIKKALKKREKMKEKSAETWKGRIEKLEIAKDEKQQKREENILKKQGKLKIDKEGGGGEKGEGGTGEKRKRLGGPDGKYSAAKKNESNEGSSPSRPGFEGKKSEFLNKKKKT